MTRMYRDVIVSSGDSRAAFSHHGDGAASRWPRRRRSHTPRDQTHIVKEKRSSLGTRDEQRTEGMHLVPDAPGKTPSYWCTWGARGRAIATVAFSEDVPYLAAGLGLMHGIMRCPTTRE